MSQEQRIEIIELEIERRGLGDMYRRFLNGGTSLEQRINAARAVADYAVVRK